MDKKREERAITFGDLLPEDMSLTSNYFDAKIYNIENSNKVIWMVKVRWGVKGKNMENGLERACKDFVNALSIIEKEHKEFKDSVSKVQ